MTKVLRKLFVKARAGPSQFTSAATLLAVGALLGNLIVVAITPILTRIYQPGQFGQLTILSSVVGIVSVIAALRLDVAMSLPASEDDAFALFVVSCLASLVTALLSTIIALAATPWASASFDRSLPFGVVVGATIFGASITSIVQSWLIRAKAFRQVATARLIALVAGIGIQMLLGFLGHLSNGLIVGYVAQWFLWAALGLTLSAPTLTKLAKSFTIQRLRWVLKQYGTFPTLSTIEAAANTASIHLPLFLIGTFGFTVELGFASLAMSILQAPMSFAGNAIGQVFISQATAQHANNTLVRFAHDTLHKLQWIGVIPLTAFAVCAPIVVRWVFGPQWERTGELAAWMTPWFVLQFLVSPISMSLHVIRAQRKLMLLQVFGLFLRLGAILISITFWPARTLESYAISGALFYGLYLFLVLRSLNFNFESMRQLARYVVVQVIAGALLGVLVSRIAIWLG